MKYAGFNILVKRIANELPNSQEVWLEIQVDDMPYRIQRINKICDGTRLFELARYIIFTPINVYGNLKHYNPDSEDENFIATLRDTLDWVVYDYKRRFQDFYERQIHVYD